MRKLAIQSSTTSFASEIFSEEDMNEDIEVPVDDMNLAAATEKSTAVVDRELEILENDRGSHEE